MFRDGLATILPKCRYFMVRVWHKYLMVLLARYVCRCYDMNNFFLYKIFNLKNNFVFYFLFFLLLWHMQLKITLIKKRNNRCKNLLLCDFVEYFYVSNETAPTALWMIKITEFYNENIRDIERNRKSRIRIERNFYHMFSKDIIRTLLTHNCLETISS